LIHEGVDEGRLRDTARAAGMRNMREDGERWVVAGVTSMDEVVRATRD
jgi:general secretion pathway protein E